MGRFGTELVGQYVRGPAEFAARGAQIGLALAEHHEHRRRFDAELARDLHNDAFRERTIERELDLRAAGQQLQREAMALEQAQAALEQEETMSMATASLRMVDDFEKMSVPVASGPVRSSPGMMVPITALMPPPDPTFGEIRQFIQKGIATGSVSKKGIEWAVARLQEPMEKRQQEIRKIKWAATQKEGDRLSDPAQRAAVKMELAANGPEAAQKLLTMYQEQNAKDARIAEGSKAAGVSLEEGKVLGEDGLKKRIQDRLTNQDKAGSETEARAAAVTAHKRLRDGTSKREGTEEQDQALARDAGLINQADDPLAAERRPNQALINAEKRVKIKSSKLEELHKAAVKLYPDWQGNLDRDKAPKDVLDRIDTAKRELDEAIDQQDAALDAPTKDAPSGSDADRDIDALLDELTPR